LKFTRAPSDISRKTKPFDWLPNGELFFPGGHVVKKDIQSAILDYFKNFTDLKLTVNEVFLSADGTKLAIQWDWTVTRK
jgi:hypothetical protein